MDLTTILMVLIIAGGLYYWFKNNPPIQNSKDDIPAYPRSETEVITRIPEDSILKRHFLANIAAEQLSMTNPYPTESVLRRHYESMHALPVKQLIASAQSALPEDSVLRRHYLSALAAE